MSRHPPAPITRSSFAAEPVAGASHISPRPPPSQSLSSKRRGGGGGYSQPARKTTSCPILNLGEKEEKENKPQLSRPKGTGKSSDRAGENLLLLLCCVLEGLVVPVFGGGRDMMGRRKIQVRLGRWLCLWLGRGASRSGQRLDFPCKRQRAAIQSVRAAKPSTHAPMFCRPNTGDATGPVVA